MNVVCIFVIFLKSETIGVGSEARNRTENLRLMRPVSYHWTTSLVARSRVELESPGLHAGAFPLS